MTAPSRGLSGKLLPVHFLPEEDELLSSWLCRLALAHGLSSESFCSLITGRKYFSQIPVVHSLDRNIHKQFFPLLEARTGTPTERIIASTLVAYRGILFETWKPKQRQLWIMPTRSAKPNVALPGQQYCPLCLTQEGYYKRKWRLAFITLCTKHHVQLLDRCARCAAPIWYHMAISNRKRNPPSDHMTYCYSCKTDLCRARPQSAGLDEVYFQNVLERALSTGWVEIHGSEEVYSLLFFPVLHSLMRLLSLGERGTKLRDDLSRRYGLNKFNVSFNWNPRELSFLTVGERRGLVGMARRLLTNWPHEFFNFCLANEVSHTELKVRFRPTPFWFWRVIREYKDIKERAPYVYPVGAALTATAGK